MSISPPLLFTHMANELVDHSLIHAFAGECRDETVPKGVSAFQHFPLAASQRSLEVIVEFVLRQRRRLSPLALAALDIRELAEQVQSARVLAQPFSKDTGQEG